MRFPRTLEAELLDELEVVDPRAIKSRRDLQRVNAVMGHPRILAQALSGVIDGARLVELGTGDGTLLLSVARRLAKPQKPVMAVLVDQRPSVNENTRRAFDDLDWHIDVRQSDVFDWLARPGVEETDVIVANLFLHHFTDAALGDLLRLASRQTRRFVACEPLRSGLSVAGASLLWLLGCNEVTRHDARISVRAGFRQDELSRLWPRSHAWHLVERRTGPFTHTFVAEHAV